MTKNFKLWMIAILLGGSLPALAVSLMPLGPATVKWTGSSQALDHQLLSTKTNHTAMSTNITQSYSSTVTNFSCNNIFVLSLIENSFNTNYPPDAALFSTGNAFYEVDSNETNFLGAVAYFQLTAGVAIGSHSHITTYDILGTTFADPESTTTTYDATLVYDDSSRTTADGTHTVFSMRGQMILKRTNKNDTLKASFLFTGTGSGTIRDKPVMLKGTVSGKGMDWPVF